jgi:predicted nucleotidyltransferase
VRRLGVYRYPFPSLFPLFLFFWKKGRIVTEQEILDILRAEKPYLREQFGLFGSFAKGTQGPESDVDLLVELKEPRLDFLVGIQLHLEEKIGKHVELIRKRPGLSERFLKRVEESIHYV